MDGMFFGVFSITKKVRLVILANETPTDPPFQLYQIWKQSTEE